GAEARRAGGEAQRQRGFVEDGFAYEVGERDLGGRDEPKPFSCAEHVFGRFWKIARPVWRVFPHEQGWTYLSISVLARMQVEHELRDRPLEPRQSIFQHNEPRAGKLRRRLEI